MQSGKLKRGFNLLIKKLFFKYHLPPIIWGLIIFLFSSIPSDKIPTLQIWGFDKIVHLIIFFVFGLLIYRSLYFSKSKVYSFRKIALISISIVFLFGVFDELYQSLIPGRTTDVFDLIADVTGGILSIIYSRFYLYIKEQKVV